VEQLSTSRLLSADVGTEQVESDGVSAALATASRTLLEPQAEDGWEVGLWEAGPGTDTDTEVAGAIPAPALGSDGGRVRTESARHPRTVNVSQRSNQHSVQVRGT
jgi:fumarate hydratase class II